MPDHDGPNRDPMGSRERAMAELRRREAGHLERHGWYAHIVFDDPGSPTGFNCHTHGVEEGYGHPDFRVVLPLPEPAAYGILARPCDEVKAGRRFAEGEGVHGIIREWPVGFVAAEEGGRVVLRVILPDETGTVARDAIDEAFAIRYRA